jgi:ATP-dependent helicase/nuclease subunit B
MSQIQTVSFCDSYVETLADIIIRDYRQAGKDVSRLAIVFGGKRPALFIKRELAARVGGAFFSPRFMTIDQLIARVAQRPEGFRESVDLDQCYWLYRLAQKVTPEILRGRETFALFLPWARELIAFIDHLDLELIDDEALVNIKANAEIGYSVPDDINRLLRHIVALRKEYRRELKERQVSSRGGQYRRAAEEIDSVPLGEFDEVLFCNFFYFHASEEKVIRALYERGQARLIFQGDERKWPVLARLAERWGASLREGAEPDETTFSLSLHSGFDGHSQVGLAREILRKVSDPRKTVVVLPDPDHLIPLLSELTSVTEEFNLSMGYPLRRSSLSVLINQMFKAQVSRKQDAYYTRDYIKVLRHPFVKNMRWMEDPLGSRSLVNAIEDIFTGKESSAITGSRFIHLEQIETTPELFNRVRETLNAVGITVEVSEVKEMMRHAHNAFFRQWEAPTTFGELAERMESFLELLALKSSMNRYPLNMNIAEKIHAITQELRDASFRDEHFAQEEMFRIVEGNINGEKIAFHGSPLKGMQVLGLFETRSLNFENVIVMDVNEGVLPNLNIYEPLIPREVMISLGLNRLELDEEIQRYLFMRLISSAKNVHLVYQENREKEKSRFVEELIWEEEKKQRRRGVVPVLRPGFTVNDGPRVRRVRKTQPMVEALRRHRYSASSLNLYLRNPMDFYMTYVLGVREREDMLDEPDSRQIGTFLHGLMEEAFAPFIGRTPKVDAGFRHRFMDIFERRFEESMARSARSDAYLLKSVMLERLGRFLDYEAEHPWRRVSEIVSLEKRCEGSLLLSCGEIGFGYIFDRVERFPDGTRMVVDYKTGGMDVMPRSLEIISNMELSRATLAASLKSFQVPLYYLYMDRQFPHDNINVALYNLRVIHFNPFIDEKSRLNRSQIVQVMTRALDFIVREILNPEVDFVDDPI